MTDQKKTVGVNGATMIEKDGEMIRKKDKYRMPKPWDNDPTLDKFKEVEYTPECNPNGLIEESSFAVLFP